MTLHATPLQRDALQAINWGMTYLLQTSVGRT
jgi:hypothetical protein